MKRLDPASTAARDLRDGRFVIRTQTAADLAQVTIPWMREAGWNPGLHDAETFPVADPAGFLVGELDGRPIACVSGVRYDDTFGFMGCYIVREGFRGHGYGMAVHEAAREHLTGCTQGGDGVLANVSKYQQIGRVLAYRNARYQGVRGADWTSAGGTVPVAELDPVGVERLDRDCFPAPRVAFLRAWLRQPGAVSLGIPGGAGDDRPRAFGVIRPCFEGWKIGPLFARDPVSAEQVFRDLVHGIPVGDPFVLDVAEPNTAAMDLVRRHGMTEVFATARMYTGPFPEIRLDRVYGVTTFELG